MISRHCPEASVRPARRDGACGEHDHRRKRNRHQRALSPTHASRHGRPGKNSLHPLAQRTGPRHGGGDRRLFEAARKVEQNAGVGRRVVQHFERRVVADDFRELRHAHQLPPCQRVEPEHCAVERRQQQHIEVAMRDMRSLV
jgi:hypothetical protein